jgi:hypothetical protein
MHQLSTEMREVLAPLLETLPADRRASILRRTGDLLDLAGAAERERCVRVCRYRAELWERTAAGTGPSLPAAREEARARRNESLYLADLLESGSDLFPEADA